MKSVNVPSRPRTDFRVHLVAMQAAFASANGKATVADVRKFATGGVDMILFDTRIHARRMRQLLQKLRLCPNVNSSLPSQRRSVAHVYIDRAVRV